MIALVLIAFAIIISIEVPGLIKERKWRELAVFSIYLWIGLALSIFQVLGIELPDPSKAIEGIYKPLANLTGLTIK